MIRNIKRKMEGSTEKEDFKNRRKKCCEVEKKHS
jgi:hypothetical protein